MGETRYVSGVGCYRVSEEPGWGAACRRVFEGAWVGHFARGAMSGSHWKTQIWGWSLASVSPPGSPGVLSVSPCVCVLLTLPACIFSLASAIQHTGLGLNLYLDPPSPPASFIPCLPSALTQDNLMFGFPELVRPWRAGSPTASRTQHLVGAP